MTALPLEIVPANQVAKVWPQIRDRIESIRKRFNEPWLPEHVFHELIQGGTYLWTTPDLRGFVVLQVLASPYARDLHVWMAWNSAQGRAGEYMEQLKAIAAEQHCDSVTFASDRGGWIRELPGVRVRQTYTVAVGASHE